MKILGSIDIERTNKANSKSLRQGFWPWQKITEHYLCSLIVSGESQISQPSIRHFLDTLFVQ
ncbi:hypothetical protein P3339_11010 [Microbulbifer sp. MLAF003]|uniref:hypothetical protein n=1 Tax=unclassified Microbulbifer TaxID=2619833 RepID=UPI0024ACBDEE|nr:hypothetical protein [Microbulbifer sp. MLAF003]WHI53253.1 hypothetical protein P3339_11010 [Microbulbifer sp. MLAF003]